MVTRDSENSYYVLYHAFIKVCENKARFCFPSCMVTRDLENLHYVVYHALYHVISKKLRFVYRHV